MPVPKSLQSTLWSYDLDKLYVSNTKDKRLIITQVLNYGDSEQIRWLLQTYSLEDIRSVLRKPARGIWLKRRLDYWLKILDMHFTPSLYEKAILNLNARAK